MNIHNTRDINFLQKIALKYEGKLLSDQYIKNNTKYQWQCKCGHIFERRFWNIIENDSFCPLHKNETISKKRLELFKKDISFLEELAFSKKGKCLSETYISANTRYQWQCEFGHIWSARYNTVKKHWCYYCSKSCKKDINWLYQLAQQNNGKCLSEKYINRNTRYKWECEYSHKWETTAGTIALGAWCPECNFSRGEKAIAKELSKMNIDFIQEFLLKGCKYKRTLKADFFLPKLNTIIEYDGIQHFQQSKGSWKTCSLLEIQKRDQIKNQFCKEKGIKLIRIPYSSYDNISSILFSELLEINFRQATINDWDFILHLRNTQNQGFINQNQISKEEHYEFMKQHYKDYYIFGYYDNDNDNKYKISNYIGFIGVVNNDIRFAIDPEYQGKGYGTILLSFIKEKYPIAIGKVKHDNIASQKAFIKAGYSCYKQDDQFCYYTI